VDELHLDPKRFQYKLGANAQGVAGALSDAKWDQHFADPIHTWVDPEDGKEYVVNGHHRYDLAQKAGAEHIKVDPIPNEEFPTAADARRFGALKNIADGNGTSIDAAKFFREEGYTPDLLAEKGISLKKSIASDGIALSHLSDDLFDRVVDGNIDPKIGAAIGDATSSAEDQEALLKVINKKTKSGVNVTPDQIRESARLVKSSPSFNQTTQDLFGEHNETRNLFIEMGEVSDYIQKQLAQEKRIYGRVSTKSSGEQLAKGGNVIKPEENAKIALRAAQLRELYAKRAVHSALQKAAERLAEGGKASEIKQDAYAEIRKELEDELGETK
jgi:ParB-like chromosome segregation protein Spo0J